MNGRVYDPLLARFGTPDPMTEDPFSTQGGNRYSYVGNSPVNFTDPSGHCFMGCFWKPIFKAIGTFFKQNWGAILQIAATALCWGNPVCGAIVGGAASAFVVGVSGGSLGDALRAGFITAVTAFANFAVGELTQHQPIFGTATHLANIAGHALVGCLSAVASHAKCGPGALAGAASSFAGPLLRGLGYYQGLVARSVVGGLASVAGGGKFANGAVTAAFDYLFNYCAKGGQCIPRTDPYLPDVPERVLEALNAVEARLLRLGDEQLLARWDNMQFEYRGNYYNGTYFGRGDYESQTMTLFSDIERLSDVELRFLIAHEFGHLTPENYALRGTGSSSSILPGYTPSEQNADAIARRILGLTTNPRRFIDTSRRQ